MPNIAAIIESNKKKLREDEHNAMQRMCNCPPRGECPLDGECLAENIVYRATVISQDCRKETYVGLTATSLKTRLANHKASFKAKEKRNATELSKHIWKLKENNIDYTINWKILSKARRYSNVTKHCNLCIAGKYYIICHPKEASVNKRTELISKCRHTFLLRNVK